MKLEDQVASIEPSKELRGLGVNQDAYFSYFQYDKWGILLKETREIFAPNSIYNENNLICSAYTVAELGEILPMFVSTSKIAGIPSIGYRCFFYLPPLLEKHYEEADVEADARAKMLIYLIKEGIIKVDDIR